MNQVDFRKGNNYECARKLIDCLCIYPIRKVKLRVQVSTKNGNKNCSPEVDRGTIFE
jgi:hypothetical protein